MKRRLKNLAASFGYEVRKVAHTPAGSDRRGIGDLTALLEDIRARGLRLNAALDCGANAGRWTRAFLDVYPDVRVLMVEPQGKMRPALDAVVAEYPEAAYWIGGVGGRDERRLFSLWPDTTGSTFLDKPDPKAEAEGRQVQLEVRTVPSILRETGFPFPQFVKMDIQGLELDVLRGMETELPKVEVFLLECSLFRFLEAQPVAHEIIAWLAARGFPLYDVGGYGRRPSDGALSHLDFVFAREDGWLRRNKAW